MAATTEGPGLGRLTTEGELERFVRERFADRLETLIRQLQGRVVGAQTAACTSALALTTSDQDIPGCSLVAPAPGSYVVLGIFDLAVTAAGAGIGIGVLRVGAADQAANAIMDEGANRATVAQTWKVTAAANDTVKLRASKTIAGGGMLAQNLHTTITMFGPA